MHLCVISVCLGSSAFPSFSLSLLCGIKWWINFEHPFSHPLKVVSTVAVMHLFKKKIQASTREVRFLTRGTEERETTPSTSACRVGCQLLQKVKSAVNLSKRLFSPPFFWNAWVHRRNIWRRKLRTRRAEAKDFICKGLT